ncbi:MULTISPECIES: PadR family transcriptional regulator [Streptomycetaceae]|uniref:PadR-like family transcriptional regulator n=1 Tax=Streptantibioticus cattleyicolor (strain ATCC 35852 / DSM 46488 / JCM 4925 / NBRC 14057 / NRRL 8057) TaxID=1003195 RepID=F8JPC2_STREN|nr:MULTISPECIES: PadR family transcriptional regulator [Streptomycetaceae]AEW96475.1 PadR-like family transcriptional regulator [Streptantibioticus cattleyicolor NRRL 8057 = DSM 46488]MYS60979.1 PadR family transcriptional regulator [Streptomyces sp. SID5468]CCB76809.1 putative PadR-like family transcriptional regulator [Streptantibioticus cattleyicolor NRRL 8057 = DSM 46488]
MAPVFAHGRLRLYLLKLLDESPRHGYEVIRLLEERFQGLYAPSAGTVYPRLAKLEQEGLVTHTTEGGRKVYALTAAGRAEVADRQDELAELEQEIRDSVSELAAEMREDVRGAAGDLRREVREAAARSRTDPQDAAAAFGAVKQGWKEQARRAKEESRRAREEARAARQQAKEAQAYAREEMQRIVRRVQDEVQDHVRQGDWQSAVTQGLAEFTREMGRFGRSTPWPGYVKPEPADVPDWGSVDDSASTDPVRDLERLLDRFRDDIRDAARDNGVDAAQLREVRRHLSTAAAHIGVLLRPGTRD